MARRVVLTTFGSHGDLHPYLALGQGLRQRGLGVTIATSGVYRTDVERAGLTIAPLRPEIEPDDLALLRGVIDPWRGAEFLVRRLVVPHIRETTADLLEACAGADLLVSHVLTYGAPIVADHTGIAWRSTILSPMVFFSAHDFPVVSPVLFLRKLRRLGPAWNRGLFRLMQQISSSWGNPVRALRVELGLDPGKDPVTEGLHAPDGVLALFSEVLAQRQPDWPEPVTICGFPFYDDDLRGGGVDPVLERFLAAGDPPVVFTLGSAAVKIAPEFFARALAAARRLRRRAVIVAGPAADGLAQGTRTPEILVVPSAPYHILFPRAAVLVHSGGIGTIGQALRSGRPQVVVPFSHDQFDNADRMVRLGVGRWLARRRATAAGMARAVEAVLASGNHGRQAQQIGDRVRREDGVGRACDALEAALPA